MVATTRWDPEFLTTRWDGLADKLIELSQALPEERLDWAPVEGVRPYGAVLRHVAFWNEYVAQAAQGQPAENDANELPIDQATNRHDDTR